MTSEQVHLSVCEDQLSLVSGTSLSWVQLLPNQGQVGPGCPAELTQLPKLHFQCDM